MERETRQFKTSGGFEVEIKTYITGGEYRQLEAVIMKQIEVKPTITADGEISKRDVDMSGLKGNMVLEREELLIQLLVVSVGGQKENVLQVVKDLPAQDYMEIVKEIEITPKSKNEKKN